jgi:Cd2+/Zn2+-exporting ATPase
MKKYQLKNIDCASCAAKIEEGVAKLEQVKFVSVNFANSTLQIDTPDIEEVKQKIKEIEPEVIVEEMQNEKPVESKNILKENKDELIRIFLTVLLLVVGLIFEKEIHNTPYRIAEYLVFIPAYLISGWGVLRGAVRSITKGKVFNEHFLMTIATLGAIAIDAMPEAVTVMLFYVIGELFQDVAVNRSRKSVKALLEIKPDYANLKSDGEMKRVSPESVKVGENIIVKAG